jgi:multisubunit Na+/H+ antiporter MnhC subunit
MHSRLVVVFISTFLVSQEEITKQKINAKFKQEPVNTFFILIANLD